MSDLTKETSDYIERYYAEMEGARNAAEDDYFKARPQLLRTLEQQALFRAGFERAFKQLWRSVEPKDGLRSLRCANRDLRSALKKICEAYMDDESPTELMKIARSALESQPSETKPSVETFRRSGPELGMSTMCECGATMVHHIAQDHLGNACVCPSHETKPVEPLSQQLAAANTAIAAMANDGWMAFSVEGMSEAQKIVDAYCIKYLLNKDGIVPDPLPNETLAVPQACPDCPLGPGAPCNEQCERGELK